MDARRAYEGPEEGWICLCEVVFHRKRQFVRHSCRFKKGGSTTIDPRDVPTNLINRSHPVRSSSSEVEPVERAAHPRPEPTLPSTVSRVGQQSSSLADHHLTLVDGTPSENNRQGAASTGVIEEGDTAIDNSGMGRSIGEGGMSIGGGGMSSDDGTEDDDAPPLLQRLQEFEGGQNFPSSSYDSSSEDEGASSGGNYDSTSGSERNSSSEDGDSSDVSSSDEERANNEGDYDSGNASDCNRSDDGDPSPSSQSEGDESVPSLHDLHKGCGGETFEGGPGNLKFNTKAAKSNYYPFQNYSQMRLHYFAFDHQLSRVQLCALLQMLRGEDEGNGFDIKDLEGVNGEIFVSSMRKFFPLLEVIKRKVARTGTAGVGTTADVLDFPPNLLLERHLMSASSMETSLASPGGKVMQGEEAESNGLASDHVFSGPVRPRGNSRRGNMHGSLARSSAFHGYDGVLGQMSGQKIHVNDVAMCVFGGINRQPCRVMAQFWDEEGGVLMASVRRFRVAEEVVGEAENGTTREGLLRVWEEEGPRSELDVSCASLQALLEIYTSAEVLTGLHKGDRAEGVRSLEWDACVGEGFVKRQTQRKRGRYSNAPVLPPYRVTSTPWLREGTPDQPLDSIHHSSFFHNVNNLPFASTPIVIYIDGFNAFGMGNKFSVGGTYMGWGWNSMALQRRREETHVVTVASPGACCEGEMEVQLDVLGALQKGCIAVVRLLRDDGSFYLQKVFLRGGLLIVVADSPQRALMLHCKHPNHFTKHPCPYCMVGQSQGNGGELGDHTYDIKRNRRTSGTQADGRRQLDGMVDNPRAQSEESKRLGIIPSGPNDDTVWGLYDRLACEPLRTVPVESLHADALNVQALVQTFFLELLNPAGKLLISGMLRQRTTLYPPGAAPLKDIVSNYSSLTGSDKWLLSSIMLLVFRSVLLQSTASLVSHVKARERRELVERWLTLGGVLEQLRRLMQVASRLSFAVRAPSFNDAEITMLSRYARDTVSALKEVLGRAGVRNSVHSILHFPDAIRDHGFVPNASTGEFAHQQHKRANKSTSGRDTPAHYARRANTTSALTALADGIPYDVTKYNRRSKQHETVTVRAGPGCSRVLRGLIADRTGGFGGAPDISVAGTPSPAVLAGTHRGGALWVARLRKPTDQAVEAGGWKARANAMRQRPSESALLKAYDTSFGCGRVGGGQPPCTDVRCPRCWTNPWSLDDQEIKCSRFKYGAPLEASSGHGWWKGGNIRDKAKDELPHSWALGEGGGEDVEIWTTTPSCDDGPVDVGKLTMGRILYFFEHRGNLGGVGDATDRRPITSWVLVFDYATAGFLNQRLPDKATEHPTMTLRGRGEPLIYPAHAIRRHVHLYHACPCLDDAERVGRVEQPGAGPEGEWVCGLGPDSRGDFGGAKIWRHKYKLASGVGNDKYLLNEHHHSISQDSFV